MGRTRYHIEDERYPYFITSTVAAGLPVFGIREAANITLDALTFMQENRGVKIIAYVLMENHLHAIIQGDRLSCKIGSFKSYTARKIIDLFREQNRTWWLRKMCISRKKNNVRQTYQFWDEGYYPKQIVSDSMLMQKIEYIHNNPVKRGYVEEPEHWMYSSARNYAGLGALIPVECI